MFEIVLGQLDTNLLLIHWIINPPSFGRFDSSTVCYIVYNYACRYPDERETMTHREETSSVQYSHYFSLTILTPKQDYVRDYHMNSFKLIRLTPKKKSSLNATHQIATL